MPQFTTLTAPLMPLPYNDVDTDQIIPAGYLKVTTKEGLVDGLFSRWRYLPDGRPNPDFPLNRAEFAQAKILLAGDNFGCGSSREHAPWALTGWGFQAVISTSFADIFRNNALKNGLLPVVVDEQSHHELFDVPAGTPITIDLASQTLRWGDNHTITFPIDPFNKSCLLEGLDQLGYLLKHSDQISQYERQTAL